MAQVFIAHSSKDKWIIDPVKEILEQAGVIPWLSELESPTPHPLPAKIQKAIENSSALIAVLTHNVTNITQTRDVVDWEISAAYHLKKPIYVFRERGVEVPLMINYITDYFTFDPFDAEILKKTIDKIYQRGFNIRHAEDQNKAILTILGVIFGVIALYSLSSK